MRIYSILDLKAEVPTNIFTAPSDAAAVRSFEMLLFSPEDSVFNNSPEDFELVYVGDFDPFVRVSETMKFTFDESICHGNSYSRALIQSRREDNMRNRISILKAGKEDSNNA